MKQAYFLLDNHCRKCTGYIQILWAFICVLCGDQFPFLHHSLHSLVFYTPQVLLLRDDTTQSALPNPIFNQ